MRPVGWGGVQHRNTGLAGFVTPQNVILMQNVIRIAAKCNKMFNAKCNDISTPIVITFLTHNVITQNVIISE